MVIKKNVNMKEVVCKMKIEGVDTYRPLNPKIAKEVDVELDKLGIYSRKNLNPENEKIVDDVAHRIWVLRCK